MCVSTRICVSCPALGTICTKVWDRREDDGVKELKKMTGEWTTKKLDQVTEHETRKKKGDHAWHFKL